jgi:aminoglycoside 3-N-acetyltransferase
MSITKEQLYKELKQKLQIEAGDLLAVHSSLSSLGYVEGGADAVIDALLCAVDAPASGTLMMPCFNHAAEVIDLRTTPSRLGAVSEAFRIRDDVIRSNNVSHSVALYGKKAVEIASAHSRREPLGKGSPFHEAANSGGKTLFIGCSFKTCSLIHVAESIMGIPYQHIKYPGYENPMKMIVDENTSYIAAVKESPGDSRRFIIVQEEMEKRGLIQKAKIGNAQCLLARGSEILQTAIELLTSDPYIFLCAKGSCNICDKRRAWLEEIGYEVH